jgi:Protein of unknown function (DUF3108)
MAMRKINIATIILLVALIVLTVKSAVGLESRIPYPTGPVTFEKYEHEKDIIVPGEVAVLEFSWKNIKAARGTVKVTSDPEREGYICAHAIAETIGYPNKLYRANDSATACMDAETLKTDRYQITIRESLDYYDMFIEFDHDEGTAYRKKTRKFNRETEKNFEFTNVFGPMSLPLLFRSLPWEVGDKRSFEVIDGNDRWLVIIVAEAEETVTVEAGTFETIRFQPSIFEMPRRRARETEKYWEKRERKDNSQDEQIHSFKVWMEKDPPRRVVKITSDVYFGEIVGELVEYKIETN